MKTCSYYRTRFNGAENAAQGHCIATKDCEYCSCGGNELKCNFYDYIRERANLEQAEMFKSSALYTFENVSPKVEVVDLSLSVNALIKALFERSDKEKQPFPWWIIEEIYEWKDKKYKGE
ncbi:MAG: hypothetical protein J6T10_02445 [Methanobrevibacter sp.]|nr:hypothetical protein [Methanobrevibacter sp.]